MPQRTVLHREVYDPAGDDAIGEYDSRLVEYNREHGRSSGWISVVLGRLRDRDSLRGRHTLREQLHRRGLPSR
ncbi:hypothetical protein [Nocardia spumae]|uniref:hypothetical protein n=1 Tax=Nocardia spumae TaxID=2887190 RepID=UPI0027E18413|nr:hypothetical protein [Nocardia spumae]